ncbi:proline-rich transmembrane protein 4 [Falco peregrinus]|uniref:proline-rich transmembrane protein 4 n=1 Tax=Falco peregrinus TaxID=8954 RepID=UPI00247A07CB|nr:proline-rich transmembrane protein 4 [Falco peregrinus]
MSPMGLGAAPYLLLALLCLAPLTAAPPPPTAPTSLPGPLGTAPGPPAPRSEAPVLSLNLGLNFKIKVRSQGNPRPAAPSAPPAPPYPLPPGTTGTPVPLTLLPSGLGWPDSRDEPGSGVPPEEVGGWGGPPLRASTTPPASLAGEQDKELELDIAIDLTAGLEPEVGPGGAVPPTSLLWAHPSPRRPIPLIPGIKAGISELASKLSAAGFLVPTAPPRVGHEVPGGNGSQEQDQAGSGAEPAHPPGRQPPRGTVPPSAAASACTQGSTCGSGGPDPQGAPATPLSWPPHFVALQTSWSVATATWGLAWEAHIYGIGCLFALLGLLGIVVLLGGPCSRPPAARLLGGLLAAAGAARAFPLFFDAYEQHGRLPPTAARLLFELPFPCLGWGLVLALRSPSRCQTPAVVALGVLHVAGVLGTVLAVAMLGRLPGLLLLPRGLFAGLVAALTLWLGCRLAEATMGLPLAVLALVVAPPPRQSPAEPPNGCALRPQGDTEALPLCGDHPEPPEADGDPTAGYRPPSPIDLRRSIDEALGARPGIFRHGTVAGISVIGTVGIGTDGTAGSSATSTAGIGTTGLPGIGTTSTTATPTNNLGTSHVLETLKYRWQPGAPPSALQVPETLKYG